MQNPRKPGLDLVRILCALLVMINHSGVYFSVGLGLNFVLFSGIIAVEFFFVMSGLLVGRSLIRIAAGHGSLSLKKFYVNRLMRILPLYYSALILTAIVSRKGIPLSCFVFLQNFWPEDLNFLSPSWSLSVEAWFYFLVPPLFALIVKSLRGKVSEETAVWTAVGVLCLIPFLMRCLSAVCLAPDWDEGIRKQIPLRLDSIGIGVSLAAFKQYHPEAYRRYFSHWSRPVVSLLGILMVYRFYCGYLAVDDQFNASAFSKIFFFIFLPLLCSQAVGFLDATPSLDFLNTFRPLRWLSNLSYGVYLLQLIVFELVSPFFADARFSISWLGFLGAIVLTNLLSAAAHVLIEGPVQKLRNKLTV